jgi:hypothetical protein
VGTSKQPIKLDLNFYTNILHIPHYFKQAIQLNERIIEDDVLKRLILGTGDVSANEIIGCPHVMSSVFGDYQSLNLTNLADIFPPIKLEGAMVHSMMMTQERNFFKVKVTVLGILP